MPVKNLGKLSTSRPTYTLSLFSIKDLDHDGPLLVGQHPLLGQGRLPLRGVRPHGRAAVAGADARQGHTAGGRAVLVGRVAGSSFLAVLAGVCLQYCNLEIFSL